MTLTVKLGDLEQSKLQAIATAMRANQSDVVRTLINEKFEALQADKTLVMKCNPLPLLILSQLPL